MTLVDFLLARIAEEKAIALECGAEEGGWLGYGHQHVLATDEGVLVDPPRFLADCEAKRRIIELHHEYLGVCTYCVDVYGEHQREAWPCATLRALASVYADHPDYRQEWKP